MSAVPGLARRSSAPAVIAGAVGLLAVAAVSGHGVKYVGPVVILAVVLAAWQRSLLRWHSLVGLIVVVVLFVPIGRYHLPGTLPFNLELYRIVVALVVAIWFASLAIDPRVRLRSTPFDRPLLLLAGCILASEIANPGRVNEYGSYVAKTLTFFLSFWLVYYVVATTIKRRESAFFLLRMIAAGGAAIGLFAIVERRTGLNIFDHVHSVLPFLSFEGGYKALVRSGDLRVFGPAQHPIALGAVLVMILPIAVYFARASSRRWWAAAVVILLGALASGSRTAISMLVGEIIMFLVLKPRETKRMWPLAVPAIVVIHTFLPGAIGGFKAAFFPPGGIIAQQTALASTDNAQLAGGRIRQLVPMVDEASRHPLFGEGLGTRISGFDVPANVRNAPILDDQWLDNLLEVGFVGFGLWLWVFVRAIRRLMRESRESGGDGDDWLFAALAASISAFAVGMLTFDAFSFTQIFFVFWILLGLSAALIGIRQRELHTVSPAPRV